MILITADIVNEGLPKKLSDYEQIYMFIVKLKETNFATIDNDRIIILLENEDDYFKTCFELILAINNEELIARLFISQSNEIVRLNQLNVNSNKYQVFKLNENLRKNTLKNRTYKLHQHFSIRAHHEMLDSILYSLSMLCFKHERNLDILYDKYFNRLTQNEIADKHQISQVAVSKKLKSNNYEMFKLIVSRL